jgi:hypothetical protein
MIYTPSDTHNNFGTDGKDNYLGIRREKLSVSGGVLKLGGTKLLVIVFIGTVCPPYLPAFFCNFSLQEQRKV